MNKLEKYSNHWALKLGIFVIMFICWLIPYLNKDNYVVPEVVGQVLVGLIACGCLICFKNTFLVLEIVLLFPFMFSRGLTLYTIPIQVYIIVPLLVLAFIAHIVIYKQKLSIPLFFIGIAAICVSLFLGGILTSYDDKVIKTLLLFAIGVCLLFVYAFFSSTTKTTFYDLAFVMNLLGMFLILQVCVYGLVNIDIFLLGKTIETGWASNSNNIAMMLLFTFPFSFYLGYKNTKYMKWVYYGLSYITILGIIFSYSRGSIASAFVAFSTMAIVLIILKESRKEALKYIGIFLALSVTIILGIYIIKAEILDAAIMQITKVNLDNLNGRTPIYKEVGKKYLEQPVFGHGIYSAYTSETFYAWSHNTFLEAASTLGTVGLLALVIHYVEKYLFCFKKICLEKIVILFGFLATDIYGFFDVSYFFINFVIVLMFVLISCNSIFNTKEVVLEDDYT